MKHAIYNLKKKKLKDLELADAVFGCRADQEMIHQAILMYQTNKRQGNASTKTRSDVQGSTRKIYRQKGTGQARHGDIKAPIFTGGGSVFGPHTRDWKLKFPVKMRRRALREVLSLKKKQDQLVVVDEFKLEATKTKLAAQVLKDLGLNSVLIVMDEQTPSTLLSLRNLPKCAVSRVMDLNAYELMKYDNVLFTTNAVKKVEEWLQA